MKFLESNMVSLDVVVGSPEEAIEKAGELLVASGAVKAEYVEAMKSSYKKNGPYFVLAPEIALPHARPEDGVNEASVSFIRLKEPIAFGHQTNDPVTLVFGLGASTSEEHVQVLQKLMVLLGDSQHIEEFKQAKNVQDIEKLLEGV